MHLPFCISLDFQQRRNETLYHFEFIRDYFFDYENCTENPIVWLKARVVLKKSPNEWWSIRTNESICGRRIRTATRINPSWRVISLFRNHNFGSSCSRRRFSDGIQVETGVVNAIAEPYLQGV